MDGFLFTFPLGASISSNEKIRLVKDLSFHDDYVGQIFQWESGSLSNNGEKVILQNAFGIIVDHVRYNDKFPWPIEADGGGAFLKLSSVDVDNHFGENWEANFETMVKEVVPDKTKIELFPNPTSDFFTIKTIGRWMEKVTLFDVLGRELMIKYPTGNAVDFDLQNFPTGIYFVKIDDSQTKKIIKR